MHLSVKKKKSIAPSRLEGAGPNKGGEVSIKPLHVPLLSNS